jgi:solute carrier family 36 (proton-coupled amino acid transporter)
VNSVKIFLGNVYLTIPSVFSKTGIVGGIMLYSLVAVLNTYTMTQILYVADAYSRKEDKNGKLTEVKSYTDLSERVHGKVGKVIVIILMFIVQFSCCVGYLYFVPNVVDAIICDQTGKKYCDNSTLFKYLMLIPTIPLSLLKTYTYLSYVSMSGIACALVGGLLLIGYCGNELATGKAPAGEIKIFEYAEFFGYVGIAMFSFEGNGIVINLKAAARNKSSYPNILRLAIVVIIIWYMILASISYVTYKDETGKKDYITQNLPITAFTIAIQILFCINALSSYPIQILCAFEIIEDLEFFSRKQDSKLVHNFKVITERVLVILVVTLVAILIPSFVDFLNISGSIGAASLGFILPPIYYFKV